MLNPMHLDAKNEAIARFRAPTFSEAAAIGVETDPTSRNIIGVGIGPKTVAGEVQPDVDAVRVYVRTKLPLQELSTAHIIPQSFGALPTDVVEVGEIIAYQGADTEQRQDWLRPTPCGVSVGHPDNGSGTIGCLVERAGNHYILSNNHVLANSNEANVGDPVIQPGPADLGQDPEDRIAILEPYQEIIFPGDPGNPNRIDAAIAWVGPDIQTHVEPEIIDIGLPGVNPIDAEPGQFVQKHGRTTGHTIGCIQAIDVDIWVNFGSEQEGCRDRYAWFEDQIEVVSVTADPFSCSGDSGSLIVVKYTHEPVALLFAVTEKSALTFANPIDLVLQHYEVSVVGERELNA